MIKYAKGIALALYGIVGISGWYMYDVNQQTFYTKNVDNLSPEMTINYVRAMVWYHSHGKLQELRSILLNDDLTQRDRIELRISNMLMHRSSAYIREFNSLQTPLPYLGNWYQENFDFSNFLRDVYDVVFDKALNVDEKTRNISDIMEEYQNKTSCKLIDKLNKIRGVRYEL